MIYNEKYRYFTQHEVSVFHIHSSLFWSQYSSLDYTAISAPHFVALSFSLGLMLIFLLIGEFNLWHALPIAVIGILAEVIGLVIGNEKWAAIVAKSVVMSFSTFGYYGQIWFNRDFTYDCAVEEMPAGYAQQLMDCSPAWALPVVVIVGIGLSVCAAFITRKLFRLNVD